MSAPEWTPAQKRKVGFLVTPEIWNGLLGPGGNVEYLKELSEILVEENGEILRAGCVHADAFRDGAVTIPKLSVQNGPAAGAVLMHEGSGMVWRQAVDDFFHWLRR